MDKEDKRYQKAEKRIKKSFLTLMAEVGFDAVTVTDIIKEANVNRTTFYSHYKDKYDLMEQVEDEFWNPMLLYMMERMEQENDFIENISKWISYIVNYYYENRTSLILFAGEKGNPNYWNHFSVKVQKLLNETSMKKQLKIPVEYAIASFVGAASNMLMVWAKHGFQETPEEFAGIIYEIVKNIPQNILANRRDTDVDN